MSTDLVPFDFRGHPVRALTVDGEIWLIASDVCAVLGLTNRRSSLALLDEDEKGVHTVDTPGGPQSTVTVNEPGAYSLVFRSRLPMAKDFKRWLTHEVIPSIRKTGSYSLPGQRQEIDPETVDRRALALLVLASEDAKLAAEAQAFVLKAQLAIAGPKARAADALILARGDMSLRDAAQALCRDYGITIGQNRLMQFIRDIKWVDHTDRPYQHRIDGGWLTTRRRTYEHPDTHERVEARKSQLLITDKGLVELHRLLTSDRGLLQIETA